MMQQTIGLAVTAAPAAPRAGSHPHVRCIAPAAIDDALMAEWRDLILADANVFAEPWLASAALAHASGNGPASVGIVRDQGGTLIGVVPLTSIPRLGRVPLRSTASWAHPNGFLTVASAASGREADLWRAILSDADIHGKAAAIQIDGLIEDGALHRGLIAAAADLALPVAIETRVTRAMLATDQAADAYWDASVRAKKRKELRRQWARLGETGTLTTDHLDPGADPAPWIAEFLALEASGWKGARGSALASRPDTRNFFETAMQAGHDCGQLLMTALRIDGRAIAMLITLLSRAHHGKAAGFSFKTAFDEDYARYSPGVLLQRESLALLRAHDLSCIDSCAAQDHPMIDSLWRERRSVVSVSLPLPGTANRMAWSTAQAAKRLWHAIKAMRSIPMTRTDTRPEPSDGDDE